MESKLLIIIDKLKSIENRLAVIENAVLKNSQEKEEKEQKEDIQDIEDIIVFKPNQKNVTKP